MSYRSNADDISVNQRTDTMKKGRTLVDLATEIQRQHENKRDLVADTSQMNIRVMNDPGHKDHGVMLAVGPHDFGVNALTHSQIADHTDRSNTTTGCWPRISSCWPTTSARGSANIRPRA
jgi:hypothetical protein